MLLQNRIWIQIQMEVKGIRQKVTMSLCITLNIDMILQVALPIPNYLLFLHRGIPMR